MTGIFAGFRKTTPITPEPPIALDELFPTEEPTPKNGTLENLPVDMIDPNPGQPRRYFDGEALLALSESIRRYGILQPVSVTHDPATGRYTLVAGERRLRAAKLLGLDRIPAVTVDADPGKSEELAIIENIQRENLNIFEEAAAIASLITKYNMTQETAAAKLSVSQSYVANKLRLLKLDPEDAEQILEAGLTERHARALLRLKDAARRRSALGHIIRHSMNVAMTEEYIERILAASAEPKQESRQTVRMGIRDIKLFCNSIDKAVETIKRAGVAVSTSRTDSPDKTEITICIPSGTAVSLNR